MPSSTVHIGATPPALPAYQAQPSLLPSLADYMKPKMPPPPAAPPPVTPGAPPPMQQPSPPPVVAPGDQRPGVVPPMPPPIQIGANSPSFWERLNMANKSQQVPNYGMAMGQPLQSG